MRALFGHLSNRTDRQVTQSVAVFAVRAAATLSAYVALLLVTNASPQDLVGEYLVGISIATAGATLAQFGVQTQIMREASFKGDDDDFHRRQALTASEALSNSVVFGLLISGVLLAVWPLATRFLSISAVPLYFAVIVSVPFDALTQGLDSALRAEGRTVLATAYSALLPPTLFGLSAVYVANLHHTFTPAVLGTVYLVSRVTPALLMTIHVNRLVGRLAFTPSKERFRSARWLGFVAVFGLVAQPADIVLVSGFSSANAAAVFGVAKKVAAVVTWPLLAATAVIAPALVDELSANSGRSLERRLNRTTLWVTLSTTVLVFMLVVGSDVVLGIFGEPYVVSRRALSILLLGHLVGSATGPVGLLLLMANREKTVLVNSAFGVAIGIVAGALTIPTLEILGGAITAATMTITINLAHSVAVRRNLGFWVFPWPSKERRSYHAR